MIVAVLATFLAVESTALASCDELADKLQDTLDRAKMAMEPESNIGAIYDWATEAKDRCVSDERIAYLRLRASELGAGNTVGRQPLSALQQWRSLSQAMTRQFPNSARIATIQARASGTVEDARRAVALDPSYAPAQVALASALVTTDPAGAAARLSSLKQLGAVSDGYTLLACARFALHDFDGAAKAASLALRGRESSLIEPDGRDPRPLSKAHEILGLIDLERRNYRASVAHLRSAAPDSERARAILENPPKTLRPFLPRRRQATLQ